MPTDVVHDNSPSATVGRLPSMRGRGIQQPQPGRAPITIVEETYPQKTLRLRQEAQRKARAEAPHAQTSDKA